MSHNTLRAEVRYKGRHGSFTVSRNFPMHFVPDQVILDDGREITINAPDEDGQQQLVANYDDTVFRDFKGLDEILKWYRDDGWEILNIEVAP